VASTAAEETSGVESDGVERERRGLGEFLN
jgi:hypothetical protein